MATWDFSSTQKHVLLCNGGSCLRQGGEEMTQAIRSEIQRLGADARIHTTRTKCNGRCDDAPVVIVYPDGIWYHGLTPDDAPALVKSHLIDGNPVDHKISHHYHNGSFVRVGSVPVGKVKGN